MRVAFVHPFLYRYPRGIERFVINLANALVRRDVEVHVLTWRWEQPIHIDVLDSRVQVRLMPTSRYYAAKVVIPFYVWNLLTYSYDFVWVFFAGYGEAEAITFASRFRSISYGVILHYPFTQVPHRYRELKRFDFARRADVIVSTSSFVADGVRQSLGLDSVVVTSAVDAKRFQPNPERREQDRAVLGVNDDAPILLTVAALEERKGIQHVLNALPAVLGIHPSVRHFIVGEGPYRQALEALVHNLGLDQRVKLVGGTANILPYYNAADLFLLLAYGEASPLAPLEAMAVELPVIVADQPPFDELVGIEYGIRVAREDADQVASAIISLLSNPARRKAMGNAGRARIGADFTWARVGEKYVQLMNSAVGC